MRTETTMQWLMGAALVLGQGCAGSGASTTTSEAASALETVQCTFQSDRAAADACFEAFRACMAAAGADEASCRATLHDCLPPPPPGRGPHGPPPDADGGRPPRDGMHDGGCDGHGGDGAGERPMGPPPGGDHEGGPGRHGGRGGHGGPPVRPDSAAVQACRDALDACLAATPGEASCFQTEHDCMHAAFDAAFQVLCGTVTCDAATDPDCERLVQRCTEGVGGRPGAFDGGTCQ